MLTFVFLDGQSVGSVDSSAFEIMDRDLRLRPSLYISSMSVSAPFRRLGIGRALLAAVDRQARALLPAGCVYLHVEDDNSKAVNLYQRTGFEWADLEESTPRHVDRCEALRQSARTSCVPVRKFQTLVACRDHCRSA